MPCPQDAVLQQRGLQVDKFSVSAGTTPSALRAFCLTHAHWDHMKDLKASFSRRYAQAKIYATRTTSCLALLTVAGLPSDVFEVVTYEEPFHPVAGVTAWAFPSYHCDGSAMFLFEIDGQERVLYTGDFRWQPAFRANPWLTEFRTDRLYYDDFFDEIKTPFPTYAETLAVLRQQVIAWRAAPDVQRIWLQTSILGVEPLLRELADELNLRYTLSDSLVGTWRGRQLAHLLEHRLTTDQGARGVVWLGLTKLDDTHQPSEPWIIPTCTYFLCGEAHERQRKPHHVYVQFCTHSNYWENTQFKVLVGARHVNPCGEAVTTLTCQRPPVGADLHQSPSGAPL